MTAPAAPMRYTPTTEEARALAALEAANCAALAALAVLEGVLHV